MPHIEGVNVSSTMNRQMRRIGSRQARVRAALKRLGMGGGLKGKRVGGGEASQVAKAAKTSGKPSCLYALPYDDGGNNIYYYRTGGEEEGEAPIKMGGFKHVTDANIWCILLGQFDGGRLVEPGHDNRPDGHQEDEAA